MKEKVYSRDKRSPKPKNEAVSRTMSANKSTNTKPEIMFRKMLWGNGHKGYRLHYKKAPGRPDICFVGKKLAIFVNGCFWHRCPHCNYPMPKNNREYWEEKFGKNVARDHKKTKELRASGWQVVTVWECEIKAGAKKALRSVSKKLMVGQ